MLNYSAPCTSIDAQRATSELHASMTGLCITPRCTRMCEFYYVTQISVIGDRCVPRFSITERNGTFWLVPQALFCVLVMPILNSAHYNDVRGWACRLVASNPCPVSLRGVCRFLSQPLRRESLVHFARACASSIIDFDVTGGGV